MEEGRPPGQRAVSQDWIVITGMSFPCLVGVFDWEQKQPQTLAVEIGLGLDLDAAAGGRLAASVNYAEAMEQVQFIAGQGRWRLLESMAAAMARHLLAPPAPGEARAQVERVRIKLAKPQVFEGRAVPGIELQRDRSWYRRQDRADPRSSGVSVGVLQETAETGAYHVSVAPEAAWLAPAGSALYVLAGSGENEGKPVPPGSRFDGPTTLRASGPSPFLALVVARPPLPDGRADRAVP